MNSGLADRVVVITGASGGIGSAIARAFSNEGALLVLHYRKGRANVERLQRELPTDCIAIRADLTKEADACRLIATSIEHFGRIDTLIANAGSWETRDVPLHKMSLQQWRHTIDQVLASAFLSLREYLRIVAKQKHGNAV